MNAIHALSQLSYSPTSVFCLFRYFLRVLRGHFSFHVGFATDVLQLALPIADFLRQLVNPGHVVFELGNAYFPSSRRR